MKKSHLFLLLLSLSFNIQAETAAKSNACKQTFADLSPFEQMLSAIKKSSITALKVALKNNKAVVKLRVDEHSSNYIKKTSYKITSIPNRYPRSRSVLISRYSTFLHLAARYSKDPKIIEALIKAGIDINSQDLKGNTPLHHAIYSRNTIATTALIKAGASFEIRNNNKKKPLDQINPIFRKRFEPINSIFNRLTVFQISL